MCCKQLIHAFALEFSEEGRSQIRQLTLVAFNWSCYTNTAKRFSPIVPNFRVSLLGCSPKRRDPDYVRRFVRADFKSESDYDQVMLLTMTEAGEYSYVSAMLNLYSQAGRLPILRCPQLASSLFSSRFARQWRNKLQNPITRLSAPLPFRRLPPGKRA